MDVVAESEAATVTAACACCGIDEECTARYVARVAAQFAGAWVCGLCAEAIKDEAARRGGVGIEAATRSHAEFVGSARARSTVAPDPEDPPSTSRGPCSSCSRR